MKPANKLLFWLSKTKQKNFQVQFVEFSWFNRTHVRTLDVLYVRLLRHTFHPSGVNFINVFALSFYASRSQKRKKDSQVKHLFELLGSACVSSFYVRRSKKLLIKWWWNWPLVVLLRSPSMTSREIARKDPYINGGGTFQSIIRLQSIKHSTWSSWWVAIQNKKKIQINLFLPSSFCASMTRTSFFLRTFVCSSFEYYITAVSNVVFSKTPISTKLKKLCLSTH